MTRFLRQLCIFLCCVLPFSLSGCASLVSSATDQLAASLTSAVLNNNDPTTVEDGLPAYLLLIDGLLKDNPDSESLLLAAANLNGSYAGGFVLDDPERAMKLTDKALDYAFRAMCVRHTNACDWRTMEFETYVAQVQLMTQDDLPALYMLGTSWAGWIQAHSDDWNAVAEMARVEEMIKHVIQLNESYEHGGGHLYLGVLATLLPKAMGGKPEVGREHFEKAIDLSEGKHLMTKVFYARQYARLMFKRELHDRLLTEVIEADPDVPGLTLMNVLAQQQAEALLAEADDYF